MPSAVARREAFVGIDVACAKGKRLPICIAVRGAGGRLEPIEVKGRAPYPTTRGNREVLDPVWRKAFAADVCTFVQQVEHEGGFCFRAIAIDAPRTPTPIGLRQRACEAALALDKVHYFTTPNTERFEHFVTRARAHYQGGGDLASVPGANKLWMLLGFDLFAHLGSQFECLETYPHAIVRRLGCVLHKSSAEGYQAQLDAAAHVTGWPPAELDRRLAHAIYGARHDRLDAFLCSWVASLLPEARHAYGKPPDDVIWASRFQQANPQTPSLRTSRSVSMDRSTTQSWSGSMTQPMKCPLCDKTFKTGRAGWDGHVGSTATHSNWHPDVVDAETRRDLFRAEFPAFFSRRNTNTGGKGVFGGRERDRQPRHENEPRVTLEQLRAAVATFVDERNWRQFHSPRNLAAALAVEASEILEHFQWLTDEQSRALSSAKLGGVRDEIGDVLIYLLRLADELSVDLIDAAAQKLDKNRQKYPAERVRGDARKYDEY